jgi:HK97 family phage major capsid protein/HK97 family phage prohead protease
MTVRRGSLCTRDVEFRAATKPDDTEPSDGRTLDGYAAVFDQDTEINSWEGRFIETMKKGAFRKTLKENKGRIQMQYDHGRDFRVGTIPIGAYERLEEDDHGLHVIGRLFDNDLVEPIRQAIEGGAIQGMSFKFRVLRDEWRDAKGKLVKPEELLDLLWSNDPERGPLRRTIKEVALAEAGPVSTPAYAGTSVGVRSDEEPELSREELVEAYRSSMLVEETRSEEEDERKKKPPFPPKKDPKDPDDDDEDPPKEKDPKQDDDDDDDPPKGKEPKEDDDDDVDPDDEDDPKKKKKKSGKSETKSAGLDDAARRSTLSRLGFRYDAARTGTSDRPPQKETTRKVESHVKTLEELKARAAELRTQLIGIDEEARGVALDEEKQAEWDKAEAELRTVSEQVKAIEARQERIKSLAQDEPERTERSKPGAPNVHTKKDIFDLDAVRMDATSPEDYARRLKENARRFGDEAKFSRVIAREKAQERVSELVEEFDDDHGTLAKRILATGNPAYERAFSKALRAGNPQVLSGEEARIMQLGVDEAGGFAVPVQLDPTVILTNDGHIGDLRRLARVETIVGKEWQGITSDGIGVSRDGTPANVDYGTDTPGEIGRQPELAEAADGSPIFKQPKIAVTRVQGFVPFSIEIDQDWGGLRSEITRMLADAKAREENESFVLGDGTGLQPLGVVGGLGSGQKVAAAGEGIAAGDIYGLVTQLAPRYRGNAAWLASAGVYNKVRQLGGAQDHAFWAFMGGNTPSQLLGYPVHENSYMDAGDFDDTVTAEHVAMVFGDFSNFLIVDRVGMSVELVPHVMGANGRPTGQRGIYAIWRNNAKLLVPNAFRALVVNTETP